MELVALLVLSWIWLESVFDAVRIVRFYSLFGYAITVFAGLYTPLLM